MRSHFLSIALALGLLGAPLPAFAQLLEQFPTPGGSETGLREGFGTQRPFWESGRSRTFLASTLELGAIYFRPTLHVGYGKPHRRWAGVEGYSSVSESGLSTYGGIQLVHPIVSFRAGSRFTASASRSFLAPQETYGYYDIDIETLRRARYVALEAELTGVIPVPGGDLIAVASGYRLEGIPDPDYFVFEQSLRAVVDPPWAWRGRLGYLGRAWDTMRLGGAAEVIGLPGRQERVVRTGPAVSASLTHHLSVVGAIMIVVHSPDSLGLQGADFGSIGFSYKWATGDRWPEFP